MLRSLYCLYFSRILLDAPKLELESGYDTKILTCDQQFIFNVSIIAVPNEEKALKLVWMKDWVQIPENSDHIILSGNTSEFAELRINNLEFNDSGFYTLSANLLNILHSNVSLNLTFIGCRYRSISKSSNSFDIVLIIVFTIFGGVLLVMAVFLGRKIKEERENIFFSFNKIMRV